MMRISGALLWALVACVAACSKDGTATGNLVSVDTESPGVNCPAGGLAVHTGVDDDHNGELDSFEISDTRYVCNGVNGEMGSMGSNGTMGSQGVPGQQGSAGDPGAAGTPGAPGAPGAAGFGVAWLDSSGQPLTRARGAFPAMYFDASGFMWVLNPSNGQLGPFRDGGMYRIYESSDCSGTEYIGPLPDDMPAGATFRRQPDGQLLARQFNAAALTIGACSNRGFNGGACSNVSPCPDPTLVVRASDTTAAAPPTLPLLPPFHLSITP